MGILATLGELVAGKAKSATRKFNEIGAREAAGKSLPGDAEALQDCLTTLRKEPKDYAQIVELFRRRQELAAKVERIDKLTTAAQAAARLVAAHDEETRAMQEAAAAKYWQLSSEAANAEAHQRDAERARANLAELEHAHADLFRPEAIDLDTVTAACLDRGALSIVDPDARDLHVSAAVFVAEAQRRSNLLSRVLLAQQNEHTAAVSSWRMSTKGLPQEIAAKTLPKKAAYPRTWQAVRQEAKRLGVHHAANVTTASVIESPESMQTFKTFDLGF